MSTIQKITEDYLTSLIEENGEVSKDIMDAVQEVSRRIREEIGESQAVVLDVNGDIEDQTDRVEVLDMRLLDQGSHEELIDLAGSLDYYGFDIHADAVRDVLR